MAARSTALAPALPRTEGRGLFSENALEHAKAVLVELLDAKTVVRAGRDANGGIRYEERPDNPTRLAAAVKLIELEAGRAPQALDITHTSTMPAGRVTQHDVIEQIRGNPRLVRELLDKIVGNAKPIEGAESNAEG